MVGLSVVLEGHKDIITTTTTKKTPHQHQVINKGSMIKSSSPSSPTTPLPSSPSPFTIRSNNPFSFSAHHSSSSSNSSSSRGALAKSGFLDYCFLCKQKLLPGKDIYMYKGDRAFCSEECRCRQIFMDEEEIIKAKTHDHCSVAATSSSTSARRKGSKNQANGFAY